MWVWVLEEEEAQWKAIELGPQEGAVGQGGVGKVLGLVSHGLPLTLCLLFQVKHALELSLVPSFLSPVYPSAWTQPH